MHLHLIKSATFFQQLLCSYFRRLRSQLVETVVILSVCHLFGLYNPNQVADALELPKARLYRPLGTLSLYHAKCLNLRLGCAIAVELIKDAESKSASTQSRRCITVSVDDTNVPRNGESLSYCARWWSKKHNTAIKCQNVLGITLKVGKRVIPLDLRLVSKQGRGNTDKPSLVIAMLKDVFAFFDAHDIDLRKYPITFDSWYGSRTMVETLSALGCVSILIHGKNNYVMTIGDTHAKLSVHKKQVKLREDQWGCDKPVCRLKAKSPTFGECIVLFFRDCGKIRTLLVFGKPLRTCEALRRWSQHHGVETVLAIFEIESPRLCDESPKQTRCLCVSRDKSHELPDVAANQHRRATHVSSNTTSPHRRKADPQGLHDAFSHTQPQRTLITPTFV